MTSHLPANTQLEGRGRQRRRGEGGETGERVNRGIWGQGDGGWKNETAPMQWKRDECRGREKERGDQGRKSVMKTSIREQRVMDICRDESVMISLGKLKIIVQLFIRGIGGTAARANDGVNIVPSNTRWLPSLLATTCVINRDCI